MTGVIGNKLIKCYFVICVVSLRTPAPDCLTHLNTDDTGTVCCGNTCRTLGRENPTADKHVRAFIKRAKANKISPPTELAQVRREPLPSALSHPPCLRTLK